ncbi:MAG: MipA/OmpV family protein [Arcobacteraceae bacterium]
MLKAFLIVTLCCVYSLTANSNSAGLALVNTTNIYATKSDKTVAFPLVNYKYNNFYIKGLEFGYEVNQNLSVLLEPRLIGFDISGIEKRKDSLSSGLKVSYPISDFLLTLKVLADVNNVSNGYETKLKLSKRFIYDSFVVIPHIGLEWQDKKFSNYYYGTKSNESYGEYKVNMTLNKTVGFVSVYNINKKYALSFMYKYIDLDDDIVNSPIIIKNNQQTSILSFMYKF